MILNIQLGLGNLLHPHFQPLCWWVCRIQPRRIAAISIGPLINFVDWLNLFLFSVPLFGESTKKLFFRPFAQIQSNGLYTPFPQ